MKSSHIGNFISTVSYFVFLKKVENILILDNKALKQLVFTSNKRVQSDFIRVKYWGRINDRSN